MVDVEPARFEDMVTEALDGLPEDLGRVMRNVAVTVEHDTGPAGLLGLYHGVPLTLGSMLLGLAVLTARFHIGPSAHETVLSQITGAALGHGVLYYAVGLATTVALSLAANTAFGALPVLANLLARDDLLPQCSTCGAIGRSTATGLSP